MCAVDLTPLGVSARWYLLQSRPRQEMRALFNLQEQGFECVMPLYQRERLRRGKRVNVDEPLFPRYIFVRLDEINSNWYALRSTYGVTNIVRFGITPASVADGVVASFVACDPSDRHLFKSGDTVQIVSGAFVGLEGLFEQDDGEARVIILLDFMAKQQRLSFPVGDVRRES
jgi:transcriptional antiterminator RfaH